MNELTLNIPGKPLKNSAKLLNLVLFQSLWFATVFGAAEETNLPAIAGLILFLVIHSFTSATARTDIKLAGIAIIIGAAVETTFLHTGLLDYNGNQIWPLLAPIWILVLWAGFALTINGCLQWLHDRYLLAAALGAAGAPLSYLGGLKLGAADTSMPITTVLLAVAAVYTVATPALLLIASRLNRAHANA